MASIFTKIIQRDIPGHIVAEDDFCLAFLDIEPLVEGHVLVVPKKEVDYIFDLDDELLAKLNVFAKKVAKGIDKAISCQRVGVTVIGLEVPHAHIHLIPMNNMRDMNFNGPKMSFTQDELATTAEKVRTAILD
jgi:histidine triad (HIT) family protein